MPPHTEPRSISFQESSRSAGRHGRVGFFSRRRAEGFLGLWNGQRVQRFSGKRFKDVPNDEGDRQAVCDRVMHREQNRCSVRLVKQYGSHEESVFYRERSRQFRLHCVLPTLQRISRNYPKWNAQLGKQAKIRGTGVVRVDADSQ